MNPQLISDLGSWIIVGLQILTLMLLAYFIIGAPVVMIRKAIRKRKAARGITDPIIESRNR